MGLRLNWIATLLALAFAFSAVAGDTGARSTPTDPHECWKSNGGVWEQQHHPSGPDWGDRFSPPGRHGHPGTGLDVVCLPYGSSALVKQIADGRIRALINELPYYLGDAFSEYDAEDLRHDLLGDPYPEE